MHQRTVTRVDFGGGFTALRTDDSGTGVTGDKSLLTAVHSGDSSSFLVFLGNTVSLFLGRIFRGIEPWAAPDTRASGTSSAPSTFSFGYVTLFQRFR